MHTAPYKSPDEQGLQAGPVTSKGKVRANYSKEELNSAGPTQERTHTMGLRVAVGSWRAPRWAPSQVDRPPARGSLGTGGLRLLGEALTVNIKMCTWRPRIYFFLAADGPCASRDPPTFTPDPGSRSPSRARRGASDVV
jgi:hypothetical protein